MDTYEKNYTIATTAKDILFHSLKGGYYFDTAEEQVNKAFELATLYIEKAAALIGED